jgi:hypothetical protein
MSIYTVRFSYTIVVKIAYTHHIQHESYRETAPQLAYDCCIQYEKVVGILNLVLKSYNFATTFLLKMVEVERANNSKD